MKLAPLALTLASLLTAPPDPSQEIPSNGFNYCAPPHRPICVDDPGVFADPAKRKTCEAAMGHYVSSVFSYRACMYAAIEKAIRQTNAASELLKCREAGLSKCP